MILLDGGTAVAGTAVSADVGKESDAAGVGGGASPPAAAARTAHGSASSELSFLLCSLS